MTSNKTSIKELLNQFYVSELRNILTNIIQSVQLPEGVNNVPSYATASKAKVLSIIEQVTAELGDDTVGEFVDAFLAEKAATPGTAPQPNPFAAAPVSVMADAMALVHGENPAGQSGPVQPPPVLQPDDPGYTGYEPSKKTAKKASGPTSPKGPVVDAMPNQPEPDEVPWTPADDKALADAMANRVGKPAETSPGTANPGVPHEFAASLDSAAAEMEAEDKAGTASPGKPAGTELAAAVALLADSKAELDGLKAGLADLVSRIAKVTGDMAKASQTIAAHGKPVPAKKEKANVVAKNTGNGAAPAKGCKAQITELFAAYPGQGFTAEKIAEMIGRDNIDTVKWNLGKMGFKKDGQGMYAAA